mgnify:CR=1 FL=1
MTEASARTNPLRRCWGLLSPRIRFHLAVCLFLVALTTAFRAVFWIRFREPGTDVPAGAWLHAWFLGFKFDLRLALAVLLPVLVLGWIPGLNLRASARGRRLWLGYLTSAFAVIVFGHAVDLGHYAYLHERLNASVLENTEAPGIALRMVWESYPVVWGTLLLSGLSWGFARAVRTNAFPQLDAPATTARAAPEPAAAARRRGRFAPTAAFVLFVIGGLYGKWSRYPLRWSDAFFHPDRFVSSLALNPVLFYADTYEFRSLDFSVPGTRKHYARMASLLSVDDPDPETLTFRRRVQPRGSPLERPNLVLIHLESFAGFKCGVFGNRLDPTPNLDRIAAQGTLFTNFFVSRPPTARCVFTVLFGTPDIHTPHSASRNPLVVRQHCIANALEGYEKLYFLGGSASWGNIRGILAQNLDGIRIYEEGRYRYAPDDVWGISDLRLFEEANRVLREEKGPFVAFVQTAGNHKPYTIPADHGDFALREADDAALRENGFEELSEFNAMRLVDYSLGRFFDLAGREAYFRNTVFLLYGDHGTAATSAVPWEEIRLTYHHVPLVLYAPGITTEAARNDTLGSLADVLPTAMGFTRTPYVNTTLGRDLLDGSPAPRHVYIDVGSYRGLLDPEFYLYFPPGGGTQLHRHRSDTPTADIRGQHPDRVREMSELFEAYHETTKYLLYNNKPPQDGR